MERCLSSTILSFEKKLVKYGKKKTGISVLNLHKEIAEYPVMVLDQIANMEIKWTWISNQFNHGHTHHFNYYTTSLSCKEGKMARSGRKDEWVSSVVPAVQCRVLGPGHEIPWKAL